MTPIGNRRVQLFFRIQISRTLMGTFMYISKVYSIDTIEKPKFKNSLQAEECNIIYEFYTALYLLVGLALVLFSGIFVRCQLRYYALHIVPPESFINFDVLSWAEKFTGSDQFSGL